jgi:hypothetical protein
MNNEFLVKFDLNPGNELGIFLEFLADLDKG